MVTLREQSCVFTAPTKTKLKVKIAARYLVNLSSSVYYSFFSELVYIYIYTYFKDTCRETMTGKKAEFER